MKTIVFDLDGTLLDSRHRHVQLLSEVLKSEQIAVSQQLLAQYLPYKLKGHSTKRFLVEKCGISEKTAKKCAALWVEQIESWKYLMYDVLYPDARETLEQLSRRVGLQLALVTARSREQLMFQQLQELGIRDFFTRVYCVDPRSAKEKKLKAAREIESVVLWVGDTEVDQYAAEQINCPFYALNRGFRDFTYWEKVNIPAHANLLPLLKQDKEW